MDYLPITVNMKNQRCLIVGGGDVAARKLKHLLKAGSRVTLVSKSFCEEIRRLAADFSVTLITGEFSPERVGDHYLVIAATNNRLVNRQVSVAAQRRNIWVNVVDDLELSTFIMPAVIDRSPLLIAVSSSGVSPVLARKIREKIEWLLPKNLGRLLQKLKSLRPTVKKKFHDFKEKRSFSEWFIETAIEDESQLGASNDQLIKRFNDQHKSAGKVFLVGAGPGDPELLTVKALKLIQKADVVLYDALVTPEILDCVRKDATLIHVGKRANHHSVKQEQTNELLVQHARRGQRVVRLKGGDPFIFGRGGEELQVLAAENIEFEVVPGITAAAGCASYSGIPLTHRDYSQSVRFVTAHEKSENQPGYKKSVDWKNLAQEKQTLVFYMGLMRNQQIADSLIRNGKAADTPVAVIEKGTTPQQRTVVGQLLDLPQIISQYHLQAPALIIVGEVAQLALDLSWYRHGDLIHADIRRPKAVNE